jgi:D-galactarolactone isomerase
MVELKNGKSSRESGFPKGAVDCHMHVFGPLEREQLTLFNRNADGSLEAYVKTREAAGLARHVLVQPSSYGSDNRLLLAALRHMGEANCRGVVCLSPAHTKADLLHMTALGVRGIRMNMVQGAIKGPGEILTEAQRVSDFGWHCEFNASPDSFASIAETLSLLPTPVVLEHLARLPLSSDFERLLGLVQRLLDGGNTWVKVTAALKGFVGAGWDGADLARVVGALAASHPERLVWGSDWPYVGAPVPHDMVTDCDFLFAGSGEPTLPSRALVCNARNLYGFDE